jgi:hypothetical protein
MGLGSVSTPLTWSEKDDMSDQAPSNVMRSLGVVGESTHEITTTPPVNDALFLGSTSVRFVARSLLLMHFLRRQW